MNEIAAQKRFLEFLFSEIGETIDEIQNGSSEEVDGNCNKLGRFIDQLKKEVLTNGIA